MQAFQRDLKSFERLNAQVLGVSGDSLETHRGFAARFGIAFPLIADEGGKVAALYGGKTRITYIIDRKGVIRHVARGVPDNEELLKVLERITDDNGS